MISMLRGKLWKYSATSILLDVHGVGYELHMSVKTAAQCQNQTELEVYTYLHVKEDELTLYGFLSAMERSIFKALISVSGIGPKLAQRVLSEALPEDLASLVLAGNAAGLQKLKGIGKKTAEMMVLHLKTPLAKLNLDLEVQDVSSPLEQEAITALISLGLKENIAQKAVAKAQKASPSEDVAQLISEALKFA